MSSKKKKAASRKAGKKSKGSKKAASKKSAGTRSEGPRTDVPIGLIPPRYAPSVTIFGAGVTGLSAAHELIERGFQVQVVEPRQSNFEEYACEVGGFAASQYGRTNRTAELYPELFELGLSFPEWLSWDVPPPDGALPDDWIPILDKRREIPPDERMRNFDAIMKLRNRKMRPTQTIFPFTDTIVFENNEFELDPELPDENGITNQAKLSLIAARMLTAIHRYRSDLIVELMILMAIEQGQNIDDPRSLENKYNPAIEWLEKLHPEVKLRETFLLQVKGHYGDTSEHIPLLAWRRAVAVKQALIEIAETALQRRRPSDQEQRDALIELENARYREDIRLETVVAAYYKFWATGVKFIDAKTGGLNRNPDISQQIKNYMIVRTEASEENPPLVSDEWTRRNSSSDIQREAILDHVKGFNHVRFQVVEHVLPGEHGYRFFPSFYKNIFAVMNRTPIIDEQGMETYTTVFDNLVMPPATTFAKNGDFLKFQLNRGASSSAAMHENMDATGKFFGASAKDGQLFINRMLKFATSCQARRKLYERMSWLEFAYGKSEFDEPNPEKMMKEAGEGIGPYSKSYQEVIRKMPQALVAMQAGESDARSFGVCTLQMFKDYSGDPTDVDMVLSGPTSDAWLRPWKRYLKHRGVGFFVGNITGLEWNEATKAIRPTVDGPGADQAPRPELPAVGFEPRPDYYILAIPFQNAGAILQRFAVEAGADKLDGDLKTLLDYYEFTNSGPEPRPPDDSMAWDVPRDERGKPLNPFVQPLRDFTGIQFFWDRRVQIQGGHTYYFDANWGLTSLPQAFLWRNQPSRSLGYLGQMSVDLGDPYAPWPTGESKPADPSDRFHPRWTFQEGKSIWQSTEYQIAENTWRQIQESFPQSMSRTIPKPNHFHLDKAIRFSEENPLLRAASKRLVPESVSANLTPFLIQLPGHFDRLPGKLARVDPDKQQHPEFTYPTRSDYDDFCRIDYSLSAGQWLVAGSMTKTFTRLNTMEGANEAGKYAVNAIIEALSEKSEGFQFWDGKPGVFCDYHNIEQDEYPEFNPLKRLDRELMKHGLPHMLDILGTWEYLESMPDSGSGIAMPKMEDLVGFAEVLARGKLDSLLKPNEDILRAYERHVKHHLDFHKEIVARLLKQYLR